MRGNMAQEQVDLGHPSSYYTHGYSTRDSTPIRGVGIPLSDAPIKCGTHLLSGNSIPSIRPLQMFGGQNNGIQIGQIIIRLPFLGRFVELDLLVLGSVRRHATYA